MSDRDGSVLVVYQGARWRGHVAGLVAVQRVPGHGDRV